MMGAHRTHRTNSPHLPHDAASGAVSAVSHIRWQRGVWVVRAQELSGAAAQHMRVSSDRDAAGE